MTAAGGAKRHLAAVAYWTTSAREQNRWAVQIRSVARRTLSCRESGRLYDEARRCKTRRDVFMVEARKVSQAVAA